MEVEEKASVVNWAETELAYCAVQIKAGKTSWND